MKKAVITVTALITLIALKASAIVGSQAGPVDVKLTVLTQTVAAHEDPVFEAISSKTNSTATSTNITTTSKATITKTKFDSADLLALMANSFNTNFPPGSQVGLVLMSTIAVVDATGTNTVFVPPYPAVYVTGLFSTVQSGTEVDITTINASGTNVTGYGNVTGTSLATLNYDDTAFATADGTHTKFTFAGEYVQSNDRPKGKNFLIVSGQLQGAGDGVLRDKTVVLTGAMRLKPFHAVPEDQNF